MSGHNLKFNKHLSNHIVKSYHIYQFTISIFIEFIKITKDITVNYISNILNSISKLLFELY